MIRSLVVMVALATSACAPWQAAFRTVDSSVISRNHHLQPVPADDVHVFLATDDVPADCQRVALLRAVPTVTVVNVLRHEAGRLGANAVDLEDYRKERTSHPELVDPLWDATALYCPTGVG